MKKRTTIGELRNEISRLQEQVRWQKAELTECAREWERFAGVVEMRVSPDEYEQILDEHKHRERERERLAKEGTALMREAFKQAFGFDPPTAKPPQ